MFGLVGEDGQIQACGKRLPELRQHRLDGVHDLDDVGARLSLNVEDDRRSAVGPGGELGVFRALHDGRDVGETDGAAIFVGHDQIAIVGRGLELVVVVDGRVLARAVKIAFGQVGVLVGDVGPNVVDRQAVGGERAGVQLDP